MASKFQFRLFTDSNPQAQYDAIVTKDPFTFYLLNTGIGYLGEIKLFDATADSNIGNLITNMLDAGFVADDITVASTKAIIDYVADKVSNISSVLTTAFFRKVENHTLTADDLANDSISVPDGTKENTPGLLFTADIDNEEGGETFYFIPLTSYLQTVYTFVDSTSIKMAVTTDENGNKTIKAEVRVKTGEESLKVDADGVYIEKATVVNDGTDESNPPSTSKLVTESALVAFVNTAITNALNDVVTAVIDEGTSTSE